MPYTEENDTMTQQMKTVLLVDSNAETRTRLSGELAQAGCRVLQAANGDQALDLLRNVKVHLVVSELFLKTADSECLLQAIRQNRIHGTRTLAHTVHRTASDRDWARLWGASGFLIQPTRTERLRHVVQRLLTPRRSSATFVRTSRRNTLSGALAEIESGAMRATASIVVGRSWWAELSALERNVFRRRAKRSAVSLRSDPMMSSSFVELQEEPRHKEQQ